MTGGFVKREDHLHWDVLGDAIVLETPIFRMNRSRRRSSDGRESEYYIIESEDWVNAVALTEDGSGRDCFVMVRQFRHGPRKVGLEFPGGLVEPGEEPKAAITREFTEETGYRSDDIRLIGEVNPNPALMGNRCYTFLFRNCRPAVEQSLDANEIIDVELVPVEELVSGARDFEFDHALMHVALNFYLNWKRKKE